MDWLTVALQFVQRVASDAPGNALLLLVVWAIVRKIDFNALLKSVSHHFLTLKALEKGHHVTSDGWRSHGTSPSGAVAAPETVARNQRAGRTRRSIARQSRTATQPLAQPSPHANAPALPPTAPAAPHTDADPSPS